MRLLDQLKAKQSVVKAVVYARYSSDMQREESIEAQIRAVRDFAERNDILIIHEYIDRAKSATTTDRPQFQQMLSDSAKGGFDLVLVHKLDRFARNRYDSIGCRMELKKNGVSLISVLEQFDSDSPESIITESVLEAMAEYYSLNLAREVRKGQRENAYKSMWTGGLPPYGYDVDPETKRLVINEHEAEAVRIIFKMFVRGEGYLTIADELNRLGYKTKRGTEFTKTSFYNMLRNEKYIGNYVYNRSQPKDVRGRRNGHTYKDRSEWITNEGTVPAIIDVDTFNLAQQRQAEYRKKFPNSKAIETYLLSGKIFCGECGSPYCGDRRKDKRRSRIIVKYICNLQKRRGKRACHARPVNRDAIESFVLEKLADMLFDIRIAPRITQYYNGYREDNDRTYTAAQQMLEAELAACQKDIDSLVELVMKKPSDIFLEKINELEERRDGIRRKIADHELQKCSDKVETYEVAQAIEFAKGLLLTKKLPNMQQLVSLFVDRVTIYPDKIHIRFNFAPQKCGLLKCRHGKGSGAEEKTPEADESASGNHEKICKINLGAEQSTPRKGVRRPSPPNNEDEKNLGVTYVTPRRGGEGETRTPAPVTRPTPLAGAPRHQLEYFSVGDVNNHLFQLLTVYITHTAKTLFLAES